MAEASNNTSTTIEVSDEPRTVAAYDMALKVYNIGLNKGFLFQHCPAAEKGAFDEILMLFLTYVNGHGFDKMGSTGYQNLLKNIEALKGNICPGISNIVNLGKLFEDILAYKDGEVCYKYLSKFSDEQVAKLNNFGCPVLDRLKEINYEGCTAGFGDMLNGVIDVANASNPTFSEMTAVYQRGDEVQGILAEFDSPLSANTEDYEGTVDNSITKFYLIYKFDGEVTASSYTVVNDEESEEVEVIPFDSDIDGFKMIKVDLAEGTNHINIESTSSNGYENFGYDFTIIRETATNTEGGE